MIKHAGTLLQTPLVFQNYASRSGIPKPLFFCFPSLIIILRRGEEKEGEEEEEEGRRKRKNKAAVVVPIPQQRQLPTRCRFYLAS